MSKRKVFFTAAGTVTCALAIGFIMQQASDPPRSATRSLAPVPVNQAALETPRDISLEDITLTSANLGPDFGDMLTAAIAPEPAALEIAEPEVLAVPADPVVPHLGCDIRIQARPATMASVRLTLTAPCNENERIAVHHNGLMFTEVTGHDGTLDVTIPALSEKAVFVVEFDGGTGAVAVTDVPSISQYDRVALQWNGNAGFQIHAREFGASYGEAGHVWSGQLEPSDQGGRMIRLGQADTFNPRLAEIYTFARGAAAQSGTVALTVEAEVTEGNCGRDIAAQSLELRRDATLRTRDLVLSMPDCTATGDFLVLNNLVEDLKVAAR